MKRGPENLDRKDEDEYDCDFGNSQGSSPIGAVLNQSLSLEPDPLRDSSNSFQSQSPPTLEPKNKQKCTSPPEENSASPGSQPTFFNMSLSEDMNVYTPEGSLGDAAQEQSQSQSQSQPLSLGSQ